MPKLVIFMAMALLISTSTSSASTKLCVSPLSSSLIPFHKAPKFSLSTWIPQLGLGPFSQWSGLKALGITVSPKYLNKERKGWCTGRVVHASLFGVGAPEALVIGVVALLVFGPKGLAEVARNLGKTFRAFQPTIKELQEVSREFKTTLEREIGLDEISNQTQTTNSSRITNTASTPSSTGNTENTPTVADPNGVPSPNRAYTSEEYLKITEEQLKASAAEQRGQSPTPVERRLEPQPQAPVQETVGAMPSLEKPEDEVENS